jgi:hypothetical protein
MDKELKELHDLYKKHDPIWICSLLGPIGVNGQRVITAMGHCSCGCGIYTASTKYAPPEGEWAWEAAPLYEGASVGEKWQKAYQTALRCNADLRAARDASLKEHANAQKAPADNTAVGF